ncbi:hypothetical protein GCM10007301_27020 [Azorhizobium oxalatiphilum]|uniref:DUF2019 domain-containing protein n=1 Tax=Azorhizobium oxalatiphilum TaxID=980631 RepID=A0A917FCF6_9HYPH|nr:DUF2019 domain-containing protein [Azorhizobium oxalatiphilum]GGF65923.1 hypothetical protein GCM10007301_27020 [Azorhizobium oxalatiphilum]
MKAQRKLSQLPTDQLVALFVELSLEMKRADDWMENGAYNRAHKKLRDVRAELKTRPGDGRHALLPLLAHPNIQVRLDAALATLALSPEAEAALRGIAPLGTASQPFTARDILKALDDGSYKPT